jgi:hypothetical protein
MSPIDNSIPKISIDWLRNDIFSKIPTDSDVFHDLELFIKSFGPVRSSTIVDESSIVLSIGS